jgi:hypothetical protein
MEAFLQQRQPSAVLQDCWCVAVVVLCCTAVLLGCHCLVRAVSVTKSCSECRTEAY